MVDFRKARIVLDAVYKNGTTFKKEHAVPSRISVIPIPGEERFRELSIRMVVNANDAEELLEGLSHGNVSLSIEHMLTIVEREELKT